MGATLNIEVYFNSGDYDDDEALRQDVLLGVEREETYVIKHSIANNRLDQETINLICQGLLFREFVDPHNTNYFWTKVE